MNRQVQIESLMSRVVQQPDGCWLWIGAMYSNGYGQAQLDGEHGGVHRIIYRLYRGEIPPELCLDHLCRNRACVNPDHLEPVTDRENTLRGQGRAAANAKKKCCPAGHEYDGLNLYVARSGDRMCRRCDRERKKAKYVPRSRASGG